MPDAAWVIAAACLVLSALIDLRVVHGTFDVPVADLAAMGLAGAWGAYSVVTRGPLVAVRAVWDALPARVEWLLFLGVCVLSAGASLSSDGLHYVVRNVLFPWLVFGGGVAWVVRERVTTDRLVWLAAVHVVVQAGLLLPASLWLVLHGYASAYQEVFGLINNHKVLAVALAPWLPALLRWRPLAAPRMVAFVDIALFTGALAVLLSMSKTAWLCAGLGAVAFLAPPFPIGAPRRPLVARPAALLVAVLLAVGAMGILPLIAGSSHMQDAFDSRMSLNLRAWRMWSSAPVLGWGPGMSVRWLMNEAPHWRVDGVDAHGVVQKMSGELGIVGLVAYGLAYVALARALLGSVISDDRRVQGAAILGLGLQFELLLSTDCYASSYWAPLAFALGSVAAFAPSAGAGAVAGTDALRGGPSHP